MDVFGAGFSGFPFDGSDQSAGFTADKSSAAPGDEDLKIKPGSQNIPAEQTVLPGNVYCPFDSGHRQRVFRADIYVAFRRPHGVSADHHAFQNRMRVAFHDAAVHICSRVPFISVADYVFDIAGRFPGGLPFPAGSKSAAASPPESGIGDFLDNFFRVALFQYISQCEVSAAGDVFLNRHRVDETAVTEGDLPLPGEEGKITIFRNLRQLGSRSQCLPPVFRDNLFA